MDQVSIVVTLLIVVVGSVALYLLTRLVRLGRSVAFRPLAGFAALRSQSGKAVEQGRGVHFSLGRGSLAGKAAVTSTAALSALDYLTEDGCASDAPPLTTAGASTLFIAGQDSLRSTYEEAGRSEDYQPNLVHFISAEQFAMTYAAGTSDTVNREDLGSNQMEQVIGSDDPEALAVATLATDKILLGEELFAVGAYLKQEAAQLASLQFQDILRVIVIVAILLATLFNIVVG
jgi:hypothetical protein